MAIVGGVLTVFALIDGAIFSGSRRLGGKGANGKGEHEVSGYAGLNGKLL